MLTMQEAQERLARFNMPDWMQKAKTRLDSLDGQGAKAGHHLQDWLDSSRFDDTPLYSHKVAAEYPMDLGNLMDDCHWIGLRRDLMLQGSELDEALDDPAARRELFTALMPRLAPHVERAWTIMSDLPAHCARNAPPFRTPHSPATTRLLRRHWLCVMVTLAGQYDQPVTWFAEWAAWLDHDQRYDFYLGVLLAAAINGGGPEGEAVYRILRESAEGSHAVGAMGGHIIRAFLICSWPEAWEYVGNLLRDASREEGLRMAIMHAAGYSHIGALRHLFEVITRMGLLHHHAVFDTIHTWLGLRAAFKDMAMADEWLAWLIHKIDDDDARRRIIAGANDIQVYWCLWAEAVVDAGEAMRLASGLLNDSDPKRRMAGLFLLAQTRLDEALPFMTPALDDADLRIACVACRAISMMNDFTCEWRQDVFDRLKRLAMRLPEREGTRMSAGPGERNWLLWQGKQSLHSRSEVLLLLCQFAQEEHISKLREMISEMDDQCRYMLASRLENKCAGSAEARTLLVLLLPGLRSYPLQSALASLDKVDPADLDVPAFEDMLTRKSFELRRGILGLILKLDEAAVLASAGRLLNGKAAQRIGGLELLNGLVEQDRATDEARALARSLRETAKKINHDEKTLLDRLLGSPGEQAPSKPPTVANAFGFYNSADRTAPVPPRRIDLLFDFTVARRCLDDLAAFIERHEGTPYTYRHYKNQRNEKLSLDCFFPDLNWSNDYLDHCGPEPPLRSLWEQWDRDRPAELRDPDGLELVRAHLLLRWKEARNKFYESRAHDWVRKQSDALFGDEGAPILRSKPIRGSISWLLMLYPKAAAPDYLLDLYETALALVPREIIDRTQPPYIRSQGASHNICCWTEADPIKMIEREIEHQCAHAPQTWLPGHRARLWRLKQWICYPLAAEPTDTEWQSRHHHFEWRSDESEPPKPQYPRLPLRLSVEVFEEGAIDEADIVAVMIDPSGRTYIDSLYGKYSSSYSNLDVYPAFKEVWLRLQRHLVEFELSLLQQSTTAALYVKSMNRLDGHEWLLRILVATGDTGLIRTNFPDVAKKSEILSHLIQICRPTPEDTPKRLAETMHKLKIPAQRMIDLAVYAPVWARLIEEALPFAGLAEAVFWIHAHARGAMNWKEDAEKSWLKSMIAKFTSLTEEDFEEGAVDVTWFLSIYDRLGAEGWTRLDSSAMYCANGGGQTRAQLYVTTMLGCVDRAELFGKVTKKRDKDAARALGLLPLAEGADREADLIERYELLQEMQRTSRQFGAQRRESEKRAVEMGIDNLAGTAGYRDVQQLRWSMEARAVADLASGPISVTAGEVTVTLAIDAQGQPGMTILRAGKPLKAVPAAAKKEAAVKELVARQSALKKQAIRMRQSIEVAMVHSDVFSGRDLQGLYAHPLLRPLLKDIVFMTVDETGPEACLMGYPIDEGRALAGLNGESIPVSDMREMRIAHPLDLLESGRWPDWQRQCLTQKRIQPFKQIFRELYIPTEAELKDEEGSHRYAGQRLAPRQALGLLGGRGWVHEHLFEEDTSLRRTFHGAGLAARLIFEESFHSPGEVEYATVNLVAFTDKGGWHSKEIGNVTPRLFSEVMRDIDLAVSVASYAGGGHEASASSIEMRAALVGETVAVLGLGGVHIDGHHAIVAGKLASYSVHLGSALAHVLAGGSLVLLPFEPAYAGSVFLPFADEDPKTAEVLSKVLLLANDDKIKDPAILKQLRRLIP